MLPVVPVILIVLAFNFRGDGLRDAADPYTWVGGGSAADFAPTRSRG
jgi:hypothetical protein